MTTTPNPTAAEMAVRWAENQLAGAARSLGIEHVARGILDLKAQLAESERARGKLRKSLLDIKSRTDDSHAEFLVASLALAADQTTARESAENTAEETMTYCEECPSCHACKRCGLCPGHAPPAQTPEPVEPSDEPEAFARWFRGWFERNNGEPTVHESFDAGYSAGLAAERAERVEWLKSDAARVELNAVTENGELRAELERVRAALDSMTSARDVWFNQAIKYRDGILPLEPVR